MSRSRYSRVERGRSAPGAVACDHAWLGHVRLCVVFTFTSPNHFVYPLLQKRRCPFSRATLSFSFSPTDYVFASLPSSIYSHSTTYAHPARSPTETARSHACCRTTRLAAPSSSSICSSSRSTKNSPTALVVASIFGLERLESFHYVTPPRREPSITVSVYDMQY